MPRSSAALTASVVVVALAACAGPSAQQAARDREDARVQVLADAVFYWKCQHEPVQFAGQCRPLHEAYERDYAAFVAKYDRK